MQKAKFTRAVLRLAVAPLLLISAVPETLHAQEASAQETQDTMQLTAPMRAARAALSAAYMALDAAKVNLHFADDAVVVFQDESYSGRPAIEAWVANSMQGLSAISFGTGTFTVRDGEVVERNTYAVTMSDGSQADGSSEVTWRRQADGSWKVVRLNAM